MGLRPSVTSSQQSSRQWELGIKMKSYFCRDTSTIEISSPPISRLRKATPRSYFENQYLPPSLFVLRPLPCQRLKPSLPTPKMAGVLPHILLSHSLRLKTPLPKLIPSMAERVPLILLSHPQRLGTSLSTSNPNTAERLPHILHSHVFHHLPLHHLPLHRRPLRSWKMSTSDTMCTTIPMYTTIRSLLITSRSMAATMIPVSMPDDRRPCHLHPLDQTQAISITRPRILVCKRHHYRLVSFTNDNLEPIPVKRVSDV